MISILLVLLCVLLYLNFEWSNRDIFHPAVVFNAVFALFTAICWVFQSRYEIVMNIDTVLVVLIGVSIFTMLTLYHTKRQQNKPYMAYVPNLNPIRIHPAVLICLIIIQVISIYYFIGYLRNISIAYRGYSGGLTANISLYDTMTKFWQETFRNLNVTVPMFYRLGNPISEAGSWLALYIVIHNYVATKKINYLYCISIFLQAVLFFLNGSRSPLFRMLTFAVVLFFILKSKQSGKRLSTRFYAWLIAIGLVSAVAFMGMLFVMRNVTVDNLGHYLFIYVGAPLENLNNYLDDGIKSLNTGLVGEQTFRSLYQYLGRLFDQPDWFYNTIDYFTFSNTGEEIGNVYTTFYAFMYDFGYAGMSILIAGIAAYFIGMYSRIKQNASPYFSYALFIYAYLFNDLIMLSFSNRFYATVFDAPFMKVVVVSYVFYILFIRYQWSLKVDKDEKNTFIRMTIESRGEIIMSNQFNVTEFFRLMKKKIVSVVTIVAVFTGAMIGFAAYKSQASVTSTSLFAFEYTQRLNSLSQYAGFTDVQYRKIADYVAIVNSDNFQATVITEGDPVEINVEFLKDSNIAKLEVTGKDETKVTQIAQKVKDQIMSIAESVYGDKLVFIGESNVSENTIGTSTYIKHGVVGFIAGVAVALAWVYVSGKKIKE